MDKVSLFGRLGNYHFAKKEYQEAKKYYERAVRVLKQDLEENKDDEMIVSSLEENLEIMSGNIELVDEKLKQGEITDDTCLDGSKD